MSNVLVLGCLLSADACAICQAERYDEMAEHMKSVGSLGDELSVEERNLLSVAYKNAVGSRRAAWRIITSVEQKEKSKGNEAQAKFAREYCTKVEAELQKICDTILSLLDKSLIGKASSGESKVFYQKRKARQMWGGWATLALVADAVKLQAQAPDSEGP